ncbi:hypothetical protein AOLI_G00092790 [Acnodon oligacanthus]
MLQMVRTLAQFTIALEEMQENGESGGDDGGGGGGGAAGEEPVDRPASESNGNGGVNGNPQTNTEVQINPYVVFSDYLCLLFTLRNTCVCVRNPTLLHSPLVTLCFSPILPRFVYVFVARTGSPACKHTRDPYVGTRIKPVNIHCRAAAALTSLLCFASYY